MKFSKLKLPEQTAIVIGTWAGIATIAIGSTQMTKHQQELVSPIPSQTEEIAPTITPSPSPIPSPTPLTYEGEASYYWTGGCLGCSENQTMANGEPLDDTKLTMALPPEEVRKHKLLNDEFTVTNKANGKSVTVRVTDTGGFAKYNRVADLSKATKEAIGCQSLCQVKITKN